MAKGVNFMRVSLILIMGILFVGLVSALDLTVNAQLNYHDTDFFAQTLGSSTSGYDGYDLVFPNPPSNYSKLYSAISGGYNLTLDSWDTLGDGESRTLNLVYYASEATSGTLSLSWGAFPTYYTAVLTDYGTDSSRTSAVGSVLAMASTSSYSVANSASYRYLKIVITYDDTTIPVTGGGNGCTNVWSNWSDWSSCVGGSQSRTRTASCSGIDPQTETRSCTVPECTINSDCGYKEICQTGSCVSVECTADLHCQDSQNVCLSGFCNSANTCEVVYNSLSCDDGNSCTQNDVCSSGSCGGQIISCEVGYSCSGGICSLGERPLVIPNNTKFISGNSGGSCTPDYRCGDWSACKTDAKFSDILTGGAIAGIQRRTCIDLSGCVFGFVEENSCEQAVSVYSKIVEYCKISYIEVYSIKDNVPLSRIKDDRKADSNSLNIVLSLGRIEDIDCEEVKEELEYVLLPYQKFLAALNIKHLWRVFLR